MNAFKPSRDPITSLLQDYDLLPIPTTGKIGKNNKITSSGYTKNNHWLKVTRTDL